MNRSVNQIAGHGEELREIKVKIETGNFEEAVLKEKLNNLKDYLKTI